ncbi:MAG: TlpA disulfide reductase family protein [Polaribacter sp.]|nr:TlpA disulfide reductase family protein [Polaribacter sp.]MDG1994327.1 TlpA disulfide reductase family protein [Polaribacter sp.]
MRNLLFIFILLLAFTSCKEENTTFVSFAGNIRNVSTQDTLLSLRSNTFTKDIKINNDGTFKDSIYIKEAGYYTIVIDNKNYGFVFLRNGFDLMLNADYTDFLQTLTYSGKGANTSNYLIEQYKFNLALGDTRNMFALEKDAFTKRVNSIKNSYDSIKNQYQEVDTMIVRLNTQQNNELFDILEKNYETQHASVLRQIEQERLLGAGKPSPKFKNYLSYKGGNKSLDSFKGKFVYIDLWATWCKPCIAQIPFLKKIEEKYHDKNIEFVSISTDNAQTAGSWENALSKWKNMVKNKNLTGVQLYAGKDNQFMIDYQVTGIPRFILIDPKGNIVSANAPRPSDPNLEMLFKQIGL